MTRRLCLVEDTRARQLEPLSLSRPVFELLCGATSLGSKQARHFQAAQVGCFVRPHLAEVVAESWPTWWVNDLAWLQQDAITLVNSRWLPGVPGYERPATPHVGVVDGELAYAQVDREQLRCCDLHSLPSCLQQWSECLPRFEAGGQIIAYPWDLVSANPTALIDDFSQAGLLPSSLPPGVAQIGPAEQLYWHPTAQLDPMVVLDTTKGPVWIDREAKVGAFSRLEGPCYIGPGTHLHNAQVRGGTTLGPMCRIGGEIEASIVQGFSNKYHDGFLGHSYLGAWVNFGAGTQTSDLRNDYGNVQVTIAGQRVDTGQRKIGSYIGDHTKTGLGSLLNTGTSTGIFSHLLPTGSLLPKFVPSFAQVAHGRLVEMSDVAALLRTASVVMQRRGQRLSVAQQRLFTHLWQLTAGIRRQALAEAESRRLRKPA